MGQRTVRRLYLFSSWYLRISRDLCLERHRDLGAAGPLGVPVGPGGPSTLLSFPQPHILRDSRGLAVSDKVDGVWSWEGRELLGPVWAAPTSSPLGYWESSHLY